jgi:hypothetical protein
MMRHTLKPGVRVLLVVTGLMIVHVLAPRSEGRTQGTCPSIWTGQSISCQLLPPAQGDTIDSRIQPNGNWASTFNSGSSGCVQLWDRFNALSTSHVWYTASIPNGDTGRYYGSGGGNGDILISDTARTAGGHELARTVMHETAHAYGCDDTGANAWEAFCVGDYQWGINSPPPPVPCPDMP